MLYDETNNIFTGVTWTSAVLSGPITVAVDGVVSIVGVAPTNPCAALKLDDGGYNVIVNGNVTANPVAAGGYGVWLVDTAGLGGVPVSKIAVGATGSLTGSSTGIQADYATNVVNKGLISGTLGTGVSISDTSADYSIANSGTIYGGNAGIAVFGAGKHTITNSGYVGGIEESIVYLGWSIAGSIGVDIVKNSGHLEGDVNLDEGADVFTNTGTVKGVVDLWGGDDVFTGGAAAEKVIDAGGADNYKFGDGIDVFLAVGTNSGDAFTDKVDGGTHSGANVRFGVFGDIYDASLATDAMFINLASTLSTEVINGDSLGALSTFGTDIGLDVVKNFEEVRCGSNNDVVFGTSAANRISGNAGDDYLYGGAGNDKIEGSTGIDNIFGDAGKDQLFGGSDADIFRYRAMSDSTVSHIGRDTIYDFVSGIDLISFAHMGLATDHWMTGGLVVDGMDEAFDGVAGSVRAISTDFGWTIQLDVDGNKKADMAIDVVDLDHVITWDATDFVF